MDKEYLADYEAREKEEYERIDVSYANVIDSTPIREAFRKKFKRLNDPVARTAKNERIWPQIPMCGTLVVGLSPFSVNQFDTYHGFSASDIDRLVDFAKDTGRVAFTLEDDATEYASLDFLDSVFTELRPPRGWMLYSRRQGVLSSEIDHAKIEFDALAQVRFYEYINRIASNREVIRLFGPNADLTTIFSTFELVYTSLKLLGFQRLVDNVSDALVEDPAQAVNLLSILGNLVVGPRTDPLHAIANTSRERIEKSHGIPALQTDEQAARSANVRSRVNVCEIGKFLMTKLAPYPESFEACRAMCDKFEIYDLVDTVNSLQAAVEAEDYSAIRSRGRDLSEVLDNIWQEANTIETNTALVRGGVTLGIAILGTVAAGPIGALGGILASLGYNAVEWFLETKTDALSEKAAKSLSPNYLVNIFDFRRKYNLDSKQH